MKLGPPIGLAALIAAASAPATLMAAAWAQHPPAHGPATKSLQEHPVTADDPRLHLFYDLLVNARARGVEKVDAALEREIRDMAGKYPAGHGLEPKAWEDHVVDMANQMLAIGKKDPKVFQSYESFVVGLRGPQ